MNVEATQPKNVHQGRNIKRFREMLGIKQEALAFELGEDWNQKKISLLEQKEEIEPTLLQQISGVLKIPVEAFQSFDEEKAINIIANTFHDSAVANTFSDSAQVNFKCTFNPFDKVMELFERLLESEKEKTKLMKDILDKMG
ncbi:XRE family transcriptional regulator [Apibacter muscae]|uniref:XRE family transcriptional regulator n=1 Tax=Apibacter muscae TaxID=2509004 RepID=A0A563D8H3_9FLAO|nr:helix-turn-helix transcriptional regulator [Apibacter muscae]TWP22888.1 XRE family transcriptional regulator [Apibacter muscae]TWP26231.1 XRE family transcriptional regulator [Apibacter muscae]TWP28073.1 XRE family transcriptional regulator [Apibacter muscae]